jgi:hypothetical protein
MSAGIHVVFRTPWPGNPRVNIQKGSNGDAKIYQIRQFLAAIDKLPSVRQCAALQGGGEGGRGRAAEARACPGPVHTET